MERLHKWALHLSEALNVLHSDEIRIVHGDVELRNIFVNDRDEAVLGDFGISMYLASMGGQGVRLDNLLHLKGLTELSTPPELRGLYSEIASIMADPGHDERLEKLHGALYKGLMSAAADVWAMGCCLIRLLLGPITAAQADSLCRLRDVERRAAVQARAVATRGGGSARDGRWLDSVVEAAAMALGPTPRCTAHELVCVLKAPTPSLLTPQLNSHTIARPDLVEEVKSALLQRASSMVAITSEPMNRVRMWGMGGVGKTTLAKMAVADPEVKRQYRDGIAWVTLGNGDVSLIARQAMMYEQLLGRTPTPAFTDVEQGKQALRRALSRLACLVVLDDVWKLEHAEALNVVGLEGAMLMTSRFELVRGARVVKVATLSEAAGGVAVSMLREYSGCRQGDVRLSCPRGCSLI